MPEVALFAHARSPVPCGHLDLESLYEAIRTGRWADQMAVVRQARTALDAATDPAELERLKAAWQEAKSRLPAATLSCDCATRERKVPLAERGIELTERLQIDFDAHGSTANDRKLPSGSAGFLDRSMLMAACAAWSLCSVGSV